MADLQYMMWGPDWTLNDPMDNYVTNWQIGAGAAITQYSGYVRIDASAGDDLLFRNEPTKSLPYTIDMVVISKGTNNAFRIGDGVNRLWIYFPDTNGVRKYYRLIIRVYDSNPGSIALYENGKLIKSKADLVESSTSIVMGYQVTNNAVTGVDYLEIYHHKHAFGADWGAPMLDRMLDTIYLDNRGGYELLFHMVGAGMPPRSFVEDKMPFEAGTLWRETVIDPRNVSLGIKITGSSSSDLNDKLRSMYRVFRDPGKLVAKMTDGYRYLNCRYSHGLEGEETPDVKTSKVQKSVVEFRAFDPYWWSTSPILLAFPPVANAETSMIVNNPGDVDVYPEIFVTGPGQFTRLDNLTTGKMMSLNFSFSSNSQFAYIRMQPGARTIMDQTYSSVWSKFNYGTFFSLLPGDNKIKVSFGTGTDATTKAFILFYPRYLGV